MGDQKGPDLISTLPDDILRRIGSLVPLKEAVQTSILSSRWRRLWAPIQLNFYLDTVMEMKLGAFMVEGSVRFLTGTFLASYAVPEALELCFTGHPGVNYERPGGPEGELMTIKATKGVAKELHLQFSENIKGSRSYRLILEQALTVGNLAELRRLHLRSVASLSSSFVSCLFTSCHLLESLSIEKCPGLEAIAIDKNSGLQALAILDCPNLDSVSICALELKSLRYRGALLRIELQSTLSLAEVALDLRDGPGPGEFDCEEVLSLLDSMKEVQALTISGWLLEVHLV